jgi:hypothetical protein
MIRSIAILLLSMTVISCTIQETTVFNEDFSGTTTIAIDLTMMLSIMKGMDENALDNFYDDMTQEKMDSIMAAANQEEELMSRGLNMSMSFDSATTTMNISYDFNSLDDANILAKNAAQSNPEVRQEIVNYEWEREGKVLIMPGPGAGGEGADMGADMMIFIIERTFPMKIKSVSDERVQISDDEKTISLRLNMEQLAQEPMETITVTFK